MKTQKISTGAAISTRLLSAHSPLIASAARTKPRKVLPASPRKIAAGARRAEVEGKEAQAAPDHGRGEPAEERLEAQECEQPQKARRDDAEAGGQAIHAVEEVHGVGDAEQPEDRQEGVEQIPQHSRGNRVRATPEPITMPTATSCASSLTAAGIW